MRIHYPIFNFSVDHRILHARACWYNPCDTCYCLFLWFLCCWIYPHRLWESFAKIFIITRTPLDEQINESNGERLNRIAHYEVVTISYSSCSGFVWWKYCSRDSPFLVILYMFFVLLSIESETSSSNSSPWSTSDEIALFRGFHDKFASYIILVGFSSPFLITFRISR